MSLLVIDGSDYIDAISTRLLLNVVHQGYCVGHS
jgi:hypothetical protein